MAADGVVGNAPGGVGDREASRLGGKLRRAHDLQQEIAELVAQSRRLTAFDRLEDLVALLEEVGAQALRRLLAVPGTALRAAQAGHEIDETAEPLRDARVRHRSTVSAGSPPATPAVGWQRRCARSTV